MSERREIDERDIDRLLVALTDQQIARLFGWTEAEVYRLRRSRRTHVKKTPTFDGSQDRGRS